LCYCRGGVTACFHGVTVGEELGGCGAAARYW